MLRRFISIVPKKVQIWASVLAPSALLIGLIVGYATSARGALAWTLPAFGSAALLIGTLAAVWLLCLGFVFADARRRAMRPVLWVLVAALFPHLLGFLLYFVLRQPIASACPHCGNTVPLHRPFCSWCGAALAGANPANGPLSANSLQEASQ